MELTVLTVPDCPNGPVLTERLARVLAGRAGVRVVHRVVRGEGDAVRFGMCGSPTLLIDGVDPFAMPGTRPSLSCRIYRDEAGRTDGAPSVADLRQVLAPQDSLGRAGRGRIAPVEGGLRAVHQRVLRAFAKAGRAPAAAELDEAAAPYGTTGRAVLGRLHDEDFLRLDATGNIEAAYPFSATPTAHVVEIQGGPRVFSMCAIDALGVAAMLGTSATITSAEPGTGAPISVAVPAGNAQATWRPTTAVVFAGQRTTCGTAAADMCCGCVNFFTSPAAATSWAVTHPDVTGQVLRQEDALRTGAQIFGPVLDRQPGVVEL